MDTIELDQDAIAAELTAALCAVSDPGTYLHTVDDDLPRSRAVAAERAKAMTGLYLFEVEGLIRAAVRARDRGICHVPSVVHNAWLRWLQLHGRQAAFTVPMDGWLVGAFPKLMTQDDDWLEILGGSVRLGGTEQARRGLGVDAALFTPARLSGPIWGIPDLPSSLQALIISTNRDTASSIDQPDRRYGSLPGRIWSRLQEAFITSLSRPRKLNESYFPGH